MRAVAILFLLVIVATFMTGCSAYKIPDIDLTQESIPTGYKIKPEWVSTYKLYRDIDKIDFVVLRARNYGGYSEYRLFMEKMLAEIGFKSVISESEFEKTIEAKGLARKTELGYSLEYLNYIYKEIGPFLYISASLNNVSGQYPIWENRLLIADPESSDVLVKFAYRKTGWMSLDDEFNYPTINFIHEWYKESKNVENHQ